MFFSLTWCYLHCLHVCNQTFSPQLGLVVKQEPKLWQRICSYCHRFFIIVLLLFTCILQNFVCFRRDGFVISPELSNLNKSACDAVQHLILSNITLEVLVIVAYTILILYFTTWELGNNEKVSNYQFRCNMWRHRWCWTFHVAQNRL